jgi:hypothetical protein
MQVAGRLGRSLITLVVAAASFLAAGSSSFAQELTQAERTERFLKTVSFVPEATLRQMPGMTPEIAGKVMASRKANGPFKSLDQFKSAAGLTDEQLQKITDPYLHPKAESDPPPGQNPMDPKLPPPYSKPGKTGGKKTFGGSAKPEEAAPSKDSQKLDLEVKSDYYSILPGYDLSKADDTKKKVFLDTINHEQCTCGCTGETLAWCLVNDPGCPVVKARVKKVYTDTFGQPPPVAGQP